MEKIRIGTCGYQYYTPEPGWKETFESKLHAYSEAFDVVELNRTFYELPQIDTAERWHSEVNEGFEFTVKAWQALTHPWNSPTWNNHRDTVPNSHTDEVGYLQPSMFVFEAWNQLRARALALEASVIVVQTPPSFGWSEEHESNMRKFFGTVNREEFDIAWEPRGDWREHPDRVATLCEDLGLIHVVDIMREEPLDDSSVVYTRLHGLNQDRYDYNYEYSAEELDVLAEKLTEYAASHDRVYCMFNNYEMYSNTQMLQTRIK